MPAKRPRNVTIKDVALRAGVSAMSVSNYLNGRFRSMTEQTRQHIAKSAAELHYRPHTAARGLRLRKAYSVGMIVVDPSTNFLSDPFIGRVVSGLSAELARHGYACLLQGLQRCEVSETLFATYARTDAMCIFASGTAATRRGFVQSLLALHEPIVLVEETELFAGADVATVRQDDRHGAFELVRHLLDCGARSFMFLTPAPVWAAMTERERGIRAALRTCATATRLHKLTCGFGNFDDVSAVLPRWLGEHQPVDAIIGNNDQIGISASRVLIRRGLRIPQDVMVTGFNAFELWNYSDPPLTTVVTPPYQLGEQAAKLLLERLETGRFSTRELVLPVSLRIAGSTSSSSP